MNHQEAGKKGGLATKAKFGVLHFSELGKLGGRPPIQIITNETATSKVREVMPLPGSISKLKELWRSHPLYHIHCENHNEGS